MASWDLVRGRSVLTVFVIARRSLFRAAVECVLEGDMSFMVVGFALDAATAAAAVMATDPAVVLLEPPPDLERLAADIEVVSAEGRCVIVFSSRADVDDSYARTCGADGLIPKSIPPGEL